MNYSVNPSMIFPFGLLLVLIALAPLFFSNWWSKHYIKVVLVLAVITIGYYTSIHAFDRLLETAHSYVSFIVFIGALFVISGGIHITVKGEATPSANVLFLLVGAVVANLLGTTGASMLLIRPWIRMNKYRITGYHIVFFIFVVSNVGGCLTPIGDPPLFLGYLMGVPFLWITRQCWPIWIIGVGMLLLMFFILDIRNYQRAQAAVREKMTAHEKWRFEGIKNCFFLAVVIGAVFIERIPFLREIIMMTAAFGSYFTTPKTVHESNDFNFNPIKEVAILFVGIFATMMPALDWLQTNAHVLGIATPSFVYSGSGALSSVLDNAPTYLSFLGIVFGGAVEPHLIAEVKQFIESGGQHISVAAHADQVRAVLAVLQQYHPAEVAAKHVSTEQIGTACLIASPASRIFLIAVSIGSVFFGANTYIGNGPNFMVKAIADHNKVHTPSFVDYVARYTIPYMVPMLFVIWWIFFRQ